MYEDLYTIIYVSKEMVKEDLSNLIPSDNTWHTCMCRLSLNFDRSSSLTWVVEDRSLTLWTSLSGAFIQLEVLADFDSFY